MGLAGGRALVTTGVGVGVLVYLMPESTAVTRPVRVTPSRSLVFADNHGSLVEPSANELPPSRGQPEPVEADEPEAVSHPLAVTKGPPPGCRSDGECSVEALVRMHAVDNTVVVTFGNDKQRHFTENWVYHLQQLGVGGPPPHVRRRPHAASLRLPHGRSLLPRPLSAPCEHLHPSGCSWA
jgi:hypothetical protein